MESQRFIKNISGRKFETLGLNLSILDKRSNEVHWSPKRDP